MLLGGGGGAIITVGAAECGVPTYHIHQSHIKEHASCDGEDPASETVCVLAHSCANHHANVGHEGGQQIVDNGLLHCHPGFQQHRKVTCQPGETHTHTHTHFKAIKAIPMHLSSYSDTRIPTRDALVTDSSVMNDSVGPQTFIKVKMTESVKLRQ